MHSLDNGAPYLHHVLAVPRLHEVTKCVTDRPRCSVFGWFLVHEKLYDLQTNAKNAKHKKRKKKKKKAIEAVVS
jgi:hypothetical protein